MQIRFRKGNIVIIGYKDEIYHLLLLENLKNKPRYTYNTIIIKATGNTNKPGQQGYITLINTNIKILDTYYNKKIKDLYL